MTEETLPISCISADPFIKLGDSNNGAKVPVLDYNLPQTSSFVANGYFPLTLMSNKFKSSVLSPPADNYFTRIETAYASAGSSTEFQRKVSASISNNYAAVTAFSPAGLGSTVSVVSAQPTMDIGNAIVVDLTAEMDVMPAFDITVAGVSPDDLAKLAIISQPIIMKNLAGQDVIETVKKPNTLRPTITIVEHYRVNTYLGNYGAGETRKTFSLLPGEKTTIMVKSWKTTTENRKQTENVLDSFNSESASDLENLAQQESNDVSKSETTKDCKISGGLNIPLMGGLGTGNLTMSNSKSSTSMREQTTKTLNRAISKQTQKSVAQRKVEVNTEQTTSITAGDENTVTRVLENLNKSRTLNFVFRQLNQELVTVTYLDDVTVVFSNGYLEAKRAAKLDGIYELLQEVINNTADVDDTYKFIINHLANIIDYRGVRSSFVTKFNEEFRDLYNEPVGTTIDMATMAWTRAAFRKDTNLNSTQTFEMVEGDAASAVGINGVIVNVTRRVMPTDSLVVDSLLGQGEALDCYNMKLQDAAAVASRLENQEKEQAISIIDGITTAVDKAINYKKVFGTCCEVPQSGCGCHEITNSQ